MPKNGFRCPGSEVPDVFQLWTINLIMTIIILLIIIINTISIIIIIRTTMMMIIHADQDRLMSVVSGQKINCHSIIYAGGKHHKCWLSHGDDENDNDNEGGDGLWWPWPLLPCVMTNDVHKNENHTFIKQALHNQVGTSHNTRCWHFWGWNFFNKPDFFIVLRMLNSVLLPEKKTKFTAFLSQMSQKSRP